MIFSTILDCGYPTHSFLRTPKSTRFEYQSVSVVGQERRKKCNSKDDQESECGYQRGHWVHGTARHFKQLRQPMRDSNSISWDHHVNFSG
jgi:hypothetical protein